jgi:hypothetical protein
MEFVQRILAKVVGEEISTEELDLVSGGRQDWCQSVGGYGTYRDGALSDLCDFY